MSIDFNPVSIDPASLLSTDTTGAPDSKKLAEAAKQFEALMITQMMKSARDSTDSGWLSEGDEAGEDTATGMAEEQFAQALAASGGLGLAKMVIKTMSHADSKASAKIDTQSVAAKPGS